MTKWIHFNGELVEAGTTIITAGNRGLKYGDGLFETLKVIDGEVLLAPYHIERLFNGLKLLQIPLPSLITGEYLTGSIIQLCSKNQVEQAARVRLSVFRGNGTLYTVEDSTPCIVIECEPLAESYLQWHEKGLTVGVYAGARKSCDMLANLKSNNYLLYVMGALYARQQQWDDCLILNTHDRVCDATIANVFWVNKGVIVTTALTEGGVAGVMRRYLTGQLRDAGYTVEEKPVTVEELEQADELFLTNALYGIRHVRQLGQKNYTGSITAEIYNRYIKIFHPSELL